MQATVRNPLDSRIWEARSRFLYNKCPLNVNDVLVYEKIHDRDEVTQMNRQQQ